jgi:hypothetical protein
MLHKSKKEIRKGAIKSYIELLKNKNPINPCSIFISPYFTTLHNL